MNAELSQRRMAANARFLEEELAWLDAVMSARFAAYGGGEDEEDDEPVPAVPSVARAAGPYPELIRQHELGPPERLLLALALAPYVAPALLDPFLLQNQATGRRFTEFGGLVGQSHAGFLPTVETALFLLAGDDKLDRIRFEPLFSREHPLVRSGLLVIDTRHSDEPQQAAGLRISQYGLHELLRGEEHDPVPGPDFPAKRIDTPLDWGDLVLDRATMEQVEMIGRWVAHSRTLMDEWGLSRRLKPGYRCLFHGPPGTGKTLTASLLGKRHGVPVYRVDLSLVVSKWIGETEKNLATLFDQAQERNWILFFDEAESLFGKRGEVSSSNDRHANQQITYLLQRLEDYPGLAILATNLQNMIDEAFARRFQSSIRFPMPDPTARLRLWRDTFASEGFTLANDVDFASIADRYELTGGAIINVLRHASLMAVERDPARVTNADIIEGIRRELRKEGHYVSS